MIGALARQVIVPMVFLAACAGASSPAPTGPLTELSVSRDIFLKGLFGGTNADPAVVRRTYVLECGPAPAGQSDTVRQMQALQIIETANGRVSTVGVGMRTQEAGDARRARAQLVGQINCRIQSSSTEWLTTDTAEVLEFVVQNGLMSEL